MAIRKLRNRGPAIKNAPAEVPGAPFFNSLAGLSLVPDVGSKWLLLEKASHMEVGSIWKVETINEPARIVKLSSEDYPNDEIHVEMETRVYMGTTFLKMFEAVR